MVKAHSMVKDHDIDGLRWLFLDFDPVRPSNTSSTDAEHMDAIAAAKECRTYLTSLGWPEPLLGDSGNGANLLYHILLPNDQPSRELVKSCLEVLSLKVSNPSVHLDTSTSNPSRLIRVYGTMNCKGENTKERSYRRAKLLEVPPTINVVSKGQLSDLASALPSTPEEKGRKEFDIAKWVKAHDVRLRCWLEKWGA